MFLCRLKEFSCCQYCKNANSECKNFLNKVEPQVHQCVYQASATSCSSPDLVLWWYFGQFSGQCLGDLGPKMEVLYGKISLNFKNCGNWLLNSNFLSTNFHRYIHCGPYEEKWNFTRLWAISRESGNVNRV